MAIDQVAEARRCTGDFFYFVSRYCQILAVGEDGSGWVPFRLWPAQREVGAQLLVEKRLVMLKARQLGFTWLVLAYALWRLLFHPVATVLLFSERDDEARELLGGRLKGMYRHLPGWMWEVDTQEGLTDSDHEWELPGGSRALAFSTKGGRSYTATLAIIDEADMVDDLGKMLDAVVPTVEMGGQLVLLSTSNKSKPDSTFKKIYLSAKESGSEWVPVFRPWSARPDRNALWYERKRQEALSTKGTLDSVYQEYPATDMEALAASSLDKRIMAEWLNNCYSAASPFRRLPQDAPSIPGLEVFELPSGDHKYCVGGDPAEGNPTSDDSAACVLDGTTGAQVAQLRGKIEPSVFASHLNQIARWYNGASILVERNNHGHAVLLWLRDNARGLPMLHGHHPSLIAGHDRRPGWLSSQLGKTQLYDTCADAIRNQEVTIRSFATFTQLASIEAATLRAPEKQHDDLADAFALSVAARLSLGASMVRVEVLDPSTLDRELLAEERGIDSQAREADGSPVIIERTQEEMQAELERVLAEQAEGLWRRLAGEEDERVRDEWADWR